MRITISHPSIKGAPTTYIAQVNGVSASATTVKVSNTEGFSVNDFLLVGRLGQEKAEIVRITGITAPDTFTTTPFLFDHPEDTPLTKISYNQFRVYKSTTGIDGTYNLVATKNLMVDDVANYYEDLTAGATDYFKFSYYNSYTGEESALSPAISAAGFSFHSVKKIQDRVLSIFQNSDLISREDIVDWINEYLEKLEIKIAGGSTGRFIRSLDITLNNTDSLDLSAYATVMDIFLIEFSTDGTRFDNLLLPIDARESFYNADFGQRAYAFFRIRDNILDFNTKLTGVVRIWYWSGPSRVSEQTAELPLPFGHTTSVFVDYCLQRAYEKDRKFDEALYYENKIQRFEATLLPKLRSKLKFGRYYMSLPFRNQH